MLRINKDSISNYNDILFMLLLFYLTDSGFANYTGTLGYYFLRIGTLAVGTILILRHFNKTRSVDLLFIITILFLVVICLNSFAHDIGLGALLPYAFMILSGYIIAKEWKFEKFAETFVDVCILIATVGLIQYISLILFTGLRDIWPTITYSPSLTSSYSYDVYTIGLAHMHFDRYSFIPRFYSLFWEPGVCQAYFNIAIMFTLRFIQGKKQLWCIILFSTIVILTRSTTGYFALAFILTYFFFFKREKATKTTFLKFLLLVAVIVLIYYWGYFSTTEWYQSLFAKIEVKSGSYESRLFSITGTLEIIARYPIFGVGMSASDEILRTILNDSSIHQTNTLLNYLASYGILIGMACWFSWLAFANKVAKGKFNVFMILMALGCIMIGENFLRSFPMNILMCYGARFLYNNLKKKNHDNIIYSYSG